MIWSRYREHRGKWQREVVLAFDAADRDDPFIEFRSNQYSKAGKVVRLQASHSQPSDRERNSQ